MDVLVSESHSDAVPKIPTGRDVLNQNPLIGTNVNHKPD